MQDTLTPAYTGAGTETLHRCWCESAHCFQQGTRTKAPAAHRPLARVVDERTGVSFRNVERLGLVAFSRGTKRLLVRRFAGLGAVRRFASSGAGCIARFELAGIGDIAGR